MSTFDARIHQILKAADEIDKELALAIELADGQITPQQYQAGITEPDKYEHDDLPNGISIDLPQGAWIETDANGNRIIHHPDGTEDTLLEDPPGPPYPSDPGYDRNKAWQNYMQHRFNPNDHIYPDPDAEGLDTSLRSIGVAAEFLATPYALGGGHVPGKIGTSPGTVSPDVGKNGIDCSGFIRAAISGGTGNILVPMATYEMVGDPGYKNLGKEYFNKIDPTNQPIQPGDVVVYTPGDSDRHGHTMLYLGNGYWMEAPQSGDIVKTIRGPLTGSNFDYLRAK